MTGMSIAVNGTCVATIGLDGKEVVNAAVYGALDRLPKAFLDANGGDYRAGGAGHRIWVSERPVLPGDVVTVSFDAHCESADEGATIAELYPDAASEAAEATEPTEPTEPTDNKRDRTISAELAAEIRARPRLHDGFRVRVRTSSEGEAEAEAEAASGDDSTDFAVSLLWDHTRPHQARRHLSTSCLADFLAKAGRRTQLQTVLALGETAVITLLS